MLQQRPGLCTIPSSTPGAGLIHEQKKLKDKQYSGAAEFADDVELIFSNAMQFNQENTQIWFDAVTMRVSADQHVRELA